MAVRALRILVVRALLRKLALMALKILAVRALLRNLALKPPKVKHLACAQASLTWPS